jgi:hypothetical protein
LGPAIDDEDHMDSERFDAYVKALYAGRASRRLIATGFIAAATGVPLVGDGLEALARRGKRRGKHKKRSKKKLLRCSGDSCDGTGGKACGDRDDCQCYRAASGGNVCASSLESSCGATCNTNRDCGKGHVCVEGGPACCDRGVRFCKRACFK